MEQFLPHQNEAANNGKLVTDEGIRTLLMMCETLTKLSVIKIKSCPNARKLRTIRSKQLNNQSFIQFIDSEASTTLEECF